MLSLLLAALCAHAEPVRLAELLDEARQNNPELHAARAQARAAADLVASAGALDDPMVTVQVWNAPVDFSTVPLMVQLAQPIPLGGKRAARRDLAAGDAAVARARAEAKAHDLEAAVAAAFFDLYLADRTLAADAEIEATLRSVVSAASSRIAAGRGEQSEALRAQGELLKVQSDGEAARATRAAAAARLVALLNRPPGSQIGPTTNPGLLEALPPEAELQDRALKDRPELASTTASMGMAKARMRLADAEQVPDISIFVGEMHAFRKPGVSDSVIAGIQGNLPIWGSSKNRPKVAAASAQAEAARADAQALQSQIAAEVAGAYARVSAERRQIELHHQLIPVARQALSSATASYAAGKGNFLMVLGSERDLLRHELDLAAHLASYEQQLADLERAVGGDLGLVRAAEAGLREEHGP